MAPGTGLVPPPQDLSSYAPVSSEENSLGEEKQNRTLSGEDRKLFTPFFLRRSVLAGFLALFVAILASLVALFVYTERQGKSLGIQTPGGRYYYLWTYGPTAGKHLARHRLIDPPLMRSLVSLHDYNRRMDSSRISQHANDALGVDVQRSNTGSPKRVFGLHVNFECCCVIQITPTKAFPSLFMRGWFVVAQRLECDINRFIRA